MAGRRRQIAIAAKESQTWFGELRLCRSGERRTRSHGYLFSGKFDEAMLQVTFFRHVSGSSVAKLRLH